MPKLRTHKLRKYKIGPTQFLACNRMCAEGFKADRQAGLCYGLFRYEDGTFALHREEASVRCKFCAYCGSAERVKEEN